MLPKGAGLVLGLALSVALVSAQSRFFHLKRDQPLQHHHQQPSQNRRSSSEDDTHEPRRFDPDSLHRFLDEYASKVRRTTEKPSPYISAEDDESSSHNRPQVEKSPGGADQSIASSPQTQQNETAKKQKLYSSNSPSDDRNGGWVTLDAVPWSKSKISKWQPNSMTHESWPGDNKPYDKPNANKFWDPEYSSRPSYENNKHWPNKFTKPQWSDSSSSASNKPWHSQDRPRPNHPSYPPSDKYDENPAQAQKWPPERPTWDRYPESSRPSLDADIITDDGPPNFPTAWDRPAGQRPSYTHHVESYVSDPNGWNDRNDYGGVGPSKYPTRPGPGSGPADDYHNDRPHFSHYHYPSSGSGANGPHQGLQNQRHHPNYPFNGNGEWVLLSTNRGYSKSRQRSLKFDALNATIALGSDKKKQGEQGEAPVPSMTSKRQVRLMVLPPINGTNTTTSHGGLLEVEKTFKTVDQSKAEYDAAKGLNKKADVKPSSSFNHGSASSVNRPAQQPSAVAPGNSAVLAAVGAGMLPATMAMVLPMMLGRKKRQTSLRLERWPTQPRSSRM